MRALSTPTAILAGLGLFGAFSGLGLYFGLRSRSGAFVEAPPSARPIGEGPAQAPAAGTPSDSATPSLSLERSRATEDAARRAIDAQHSHLVSTCWNPSVARGPGPPQVTLSLSLEYAEDGHLVLHSLRQTAGARADVTMCVGRELVLPVIVSPPARRTRIDAPIILP